mgnify:CR=1 FL=1
MKDFIDIQERPSMGKLLPLSLQHLFAMFGSTVLVPYLLKVDPATALFMNGIGTLLYLFIRGKFLLTWVLALPLLLRLGRYLPLVLGTKLPKVPL